MPSDNVPTPLSYEQILSNALSSYAASIGINDFNVGSAVLSFFEVVALVAARASGDVFQILKDYSVDRATGDALQRLATENGVTPITATPATGTVSVIDTSFQKIATAIYAGTPPPNIGSTIINVGNASQFPASGSIYIGRGTPDIEGPLSYSTLPVQVGNYWQITLNNTNSTTKFHNINESVILAQGGNRSIPVNTTVTAPAVGANPDISYNTTASAVVLDGETTVTGVPIVALLPGSSGNVPIGAITEFSSPPFPNATVYNTLALTTGVDNQTDDEIRVSIKNALASIGLGTVLAVESSVIGAVAPDENQTIVDSDIIQESYGSVLFIDNGSIYEAQTAGVGLEYIVNSALGGEQFFQLATGGSQAPVAKAFLQSTLGAPFDLQGGDSLAVIVGGITYQHNFATTDFRSPGSATAYEVTASINADTTLGFEATTQGSGTYVVIRDKTEGNDSIQITTPITDGRNAAVQMGFPSGEVFTLQLFKNNILLSKDGSTATVTTNEQSLWSNQIENGDTLILSVDGTASITYSILNTDFIATGLYTSVSSTNSLESWVEVFNNKLTGVTAEVVGTQISISSNLGANNRAAISIDPNSTLVTKAMFTSAIGLSSQGKASDYTLSRNTAQFELVDALVAGDQLTAGSEQTQGQIQSASISSGGVTFSSTAYLWILYDSPGQLITTGVSGGSLLGVSLPSQNVVRYTSSVSGAFGNVDVGDYVIVWSTDLPSTCRLEGRVFANTATTLDILVTPTEYSAITPVSNIVFTQGFTVLRSNLAPQKFELASGTLTLDSISSSLQAQTNSLIFNVQNEEYLIISTQSKSVNGSVMVVATDANSQALQLPVGILANSTPSLLGFYDSQQVDAQLPLFIQSTIQTGTYASPPDSDISSFVSSISLSGRDPNELVSFLHPYALGNGLINDSQPFGQFAQETSISGSTIGIANSPYIDDSPLYPSIIRRLRGYGDGSISNYADRYFLASPLQFGAQDTAVVLIDNNPVNNTFNVPFYRLATTNTNTSSNPDTFSAYDTYAGATASFATSFGSSFDFSNFLVLMQAKKTLKPSPSNTAILYRSVEWGRSGQFINIGYTYPTVPLAPIGYTIEVNEEITILINLQSGTSVASSIDSSTQWNVTISPNNPSSGIDQVTFTWNGTGTNPNLSLIPGQYVNISSSSGFNIANTGVFSISSQIPPSSTAFTVQMPDGQAVAQANIPTLVNGAIIFYQSSSTTANAIVAYVTANLSSYITATAVNDGGGNPGAGVILLSTYEDSGFSYETVYLMDGLNWLASSNLSGNPQFTFKQALSLPSDVGYAFNNGEAIEFIPTTMDQVNRFISTLAVSGLTTLSTVNTVNRNTELEIATDTVGSTGSVQIIGGLANQYQVPVLGSANRVDNSIMNVAVNSVVAEGVTSDHWYMMQAAITQAKDTLFSTNTGITIESNIPNTGQSTILLSGRELNQRYFGKPRSYIRVQGDTFRIEQQGSLVCLSWNPNSGTNPVFMKSSLNFNDSGGGTVNAYSVEDTSTFEFDILTGNANFNELSIGDLVDIAGMPYAANNGTFLVLGVSDNGTSMQVLNPYGVDQFSSAQFVFNANAVSGDQFVIGSNTLVAGTNFSVGGTATITAANLTAAINSLVTVTASFNGTNTVIVSATVSDANISIQYIGSQSITPTSSTPMVGTSFVAGNFSASSQVSEGDTMIISSTSPFNVLNQGTFRIIRMNNNSVWFENPDAVEEEVLLPYNPGGITFDNTTSFTINATNHTQYLEWNGVGTEPHLEYALVGDVVNFTNSIGDTTPFSSANQGFFMVLDSGIKLQQITQFVMPAGINFTQSVPGQYFLINNAGNINQYYVWFNVNGTNSDPAPIGKTGLEVSITNGDTANQVALAAASVIQGANSNLDFTASVSGVIMTVTTVGFISTTDPSDVNMPAPFDVDVIQEGRRTYLECINPSAVNQSSAIVQTTSLLDNRPQIQFYEYDATVPGDSFTITNNAFLPANVGSWTVVQVLNRDTAIVSSTLSSISDVSLNGIVGSAYVQEEFPYTGYKQVLFITAQPGSTTQSLVTFTTNANYDKINQSAGVLMNSLNKLNFSTLIKSGLDSYKYNTGLIREANKIVYGDPTDSTTFPGVSAAGAEIFIREPLALRVQISLDIRLNNGVPFAQTVQQIQSAVSSVINSNPIGQSIAISSLISAAANVPGVLAVSVASPDFSTTNDLIPLVAGEKAVIIDPAQDILVSLIGS